MASKRKAAATAAPAAKEAPTVAEDIARLLAGLSKHGVTVNLNTVDVNNLRPNIQATAALNLLVAKGICTQDEANGAINETVKAILAGLLQAIEESRLKAAKTIQTPQRAPIQLARLRD